MQHAKKSRITRIDNGRAKKVDRLVVAEFPLNVRINGQNLATLVCSPQQFNFLLAGFFYLQGFIDSLDDILSLGVCSDSGLAEVRLRNELPEQILPTLTSGCGAGITYRMPSKLRRETRQPDRRFHSADLCHLMKELQGRTEQYRSHGGIHSAAVGSADGLHLYAEDIGRHNTLDRLAGEALFRKIDLRDQMLVTSGRVSSEMVVKAARLGIGLIASRTSPTDKAIDLCKQAGITLVGYLRGSSMEIYSHPQQLQVADRVTTIPGVTGVILAGGESLRMGSDKSLLPIEGARFIDHVYRRMAALFDEVIIVTNSAELYDDIPCRKVADLYPEQGALAGIHAGLVHAQNQHVFVVGCDMPFISPAVVQMICRHANEGDLVIPHSSGGHEPLHALYSKSCLPAMEQVLDAGLKRIMLFFNQVKLIELSATEIQKLDPQEQSFQNINTPEDYFRLRGTLVSEVKTESQQHRG